MLAWGCFAPSYGAGWIRGADPDPVRDTAWTSLRSRRRSFYLAGTAVPDMRLP